MAEGSELDEAMMCKQSDRQRPSLVDLLGERKACWCSASSGLVRSWQMADTPVGAPLRWELAARAATTVHILRSIDGKEVNDRASEKGRLFLFFFLVG